MGGGGVVAVCNGEIYNHRYLRPEGQADGSDAKSSLRDWSTVRDNTSVWTEGRL